MRPNIARALTAALATTGAAGAIALPTLTLGNARTPPHAFAIPAPAGEIEIEATRVPPRAGTVHTVRPPSSQTATSAPVQARSARRSAPIATPRPAAPAPTAAPVVVPTPLPPETATPAPAPQPEPTPEPPAVRAVTFAAPVQEQPNEAATTNDKKDKKGKKDKTDKKDKSKDAESDEPTLAPPPAVTDPAPPAEPIPADEDEGEQHDRGKGHDKKK